MSSKVKGADALDCPLCGGRVQFVELVSERDIEEYGCGADQPMMVVCNGCLTAYSRDHWQKLKGIGAEPIEEREQ